MPLEASLVVFSVDATDILIILLIFSVLGIAYMYTQYKSAHKREVSNYRSRVKEEPWLEDGSFELEEE